jgi:hypothetical protein
MNPRLNTPINLKVRKRFEMIDIHLKQQNHEVCAKLRIAKRCCAAVATAAAPVSTTAAAASATAELLCVELRAVGRRTNPPQQRR